MSGEQAEARAVCEHFFASHYYRGMSIRLCMTCHEPDWDDLERQLGGVRQPEPLTMPADEFAAVKAVARTFGAVATKPCGCGPDQPCAAHVEKDPPEAMPTAPGQARERVGAVPGTGAGVAMIAAERLRQIAVEGYTPGHDTHHDLGQLPRAAACYALHAGGVRTLPGTGLLGTGWPWPGWEFKPGAKPLDSLVKAGALIAAEIDRLVAEEARRG